MLMGWEISIGSVCTGSATPQGGEQYPLGYIQYLPGREGTRLNEDVDIYGKGGVSSHYHARGKLYLSLKLRQGRRRWAQLHADTFEWFFPLMMGIVYWWKTT